MDRYGIQFQEQKHLDTKEQKVQSAIKRKAEKEQLLSLYKVP
jgi:hypothetical protein